MKRLNLCFKEAFSVESSHLNSHIFSYSDNVGIKWCRCSKASLQIKGLSEFYHNLGLSFFKNKIGEKLRTDVNQTVTLNDPFVNESINSGVFPKNGSFMLFGLIEVPKVNFDPIHKFFSGIGNRQTSSKTGVLISIVFGWVDSIDRKRTLPVNYASKIGQFKGIINNLFIRYFRHKSSNVCKHKYIVA